jgi:enoyl-CoA hydratase
VETSEVLTVERDGHVATLFLDNPERRNAMGPAFWADLPRLVGELAEDDEVRCVVLAAKGPHFTVGLDLKAMGMAAASGGDGAAGGRSQAARAWRTFRQIRRLQDAISSLESCPKPVVAAVHGYCIGGGVDLVTACDIRLASEDAVFSVRETRLAIVADVGTLQRLPRIVGRGHAAELAFTGKDVPARRAKEIGLVNDVFPDQEATLEAARALAAEVAANSPLAVQGTKVVLRASENRSVADGLEFVAAWNAGFLASEDLAEAMAAFLEKRPPRFTGR